MNDTNKHMQGKMYWLHCLSPLHVGSGESAGYIDNPIMREKVTNWPFVPGSSVKGVIAAQHGADVKEKRENNSLLKAAFGHGGDDQANAGALIFTDAHLICLPVRSLCGTFAWVTSPLALLRLKRDYPKLLEEFQLSALQEKEVIYPACTKTLVNSGKVFLEDLDLDCREQLKDKVKALAVKLAGIIWSGDKVWSDIFIQRFAIVHDEVFDFLANTGTQIDTRVSIRPDQKTAVDSALWTEESLPAETILAGVVWQDNELLQHQETALKSEIAQKFYKNSTLQLGGNATVGRGQIRCIFSEREK